MTQHEKDEKFAAHMQSVLQQHKTMLTDGVRNKLLTGVIEDLVNSETHFLDIGAGSGVWAILAAKLGAKRVVAIEVEECLIPVIYKHAQENGVADRIEIIHGRSDNVKIHGRFDLIVSELFGGEIFGADTIAMFRDIRARFLAPNGILIPQKLAMFAVPVRFKTPASQDVGGLPITSDFITSLIKNYAKDLAPAERNRVKILSEPQKLVEVAFRTVEEPPSLANLTATWQLKNLSEANAIATFLGSTFTDDVAMNSFDSQSWGVNIYDFVPFEPKTGEISFLLSLNSQNANWTISSPTYPEIRPQSYSPVFAFTRLRMAQQMTPHSKFSSVKKK